MSNILAVASNITNSQLSQSYSDSDEEKSIGSIFLKAVETLSSLLQPENDTVDIAYPNVQLKGVKYDSHNRDHYEQKFDMNLSIGTFINKSNFHGVSKDAKIIITTVTYANLAKILPTYPDTGKFQDYFVNSLIQTTSVKVNKKPERVNIGMDFEAMNSSVNLQTAVCVYWDFLLEEGKGAWNRDGCRSKTDGDITICNCSHLTSFAVLMSNSPLQELENIDMVTYLGLGVSIGSLCICIFIEFVVWTSVIKSNLSHFRHMAVVNIAVSLLIADICFLCASFDFVLKVAHACIALTFLNHFFYMSLFFWSLCQSMILSYQLFFPFNQLRKKIYIPVSFLVGYIFPLGIAVGTLLYFHPKSSYKHKSYCWLHQKAIFAFIVPVGCIIIMNLFSLIVVIVKLKRPSISEGRNAEEKHTAKQLVKAVLVLTPVFGLTWALGFVLLFDLPQKVAISFEYAFAGMNAFQGFLLLLANCFADKRVRDCLLERLQKLEPEETSCISFHSKTYTIQKQHSRTRQSTVS
nr:PREDICTED: adhesion G-protein coupled receptor F3-like [Latimeria chalumnae]|eukprot:XP_014354122.1 PREDICTED: adhesion G-protein coupled receptor F3-like [Latimeria chalumnae]